MVAPVPALEAGAPILTDHTVRANLTNPGKTASGAIEPLTLELPNHSLTDIAIITTFPQLQYVDLSYNAIGDLSPLASLTHCVELRLRHCCLHQFDMGLSARAATLVPNISVLDVSHNALADTGDIARLSFLTAVNIANNRLSSLSLARLRFLQSLRADHNDLYSVSDRDIYSGDDSVLTLLSLSHNHIFNLSSFPVLPCLTELDLSHNFLLTLAQSLTATSPVLVTLDLSHNYIAAFQSLSSLPSLAFLRRLSLTGNSFVCRLGDKYRAELIYLLPNISYLDNDELIDVQSVIDSTDGHGDDSARIAALTKYWKPRGDGTRLADIDRAAVSAVDTKHANDTDIDSHYRRTDVQPYLSQSHYWALMAEKGFLTDWKEFHRAVCSAMKNAHGVADLDGLSLGDVGLRCLSLALETLGPVSQCHTLSLSQSLIDSDDRLTSRLSKEYGLANLLAALAHTSITALTLSHCNLRVPQCAMIADHLSANANRLLSLDLSHNLIGRHTVVDGTIIEPSPALLSLMACCHRLQSLNLANNGIDYHGVRMIGTMLASSDCVLETLSLDGNPINDDAVESLALALRLNISLTSLSLRSLVFTNSDGGITIRSLAALTSTLSKFNDSLLSLDLSCNRTLRSGATHRGQPGLLVASMLKRDPRYRAVPCTLTALNLSHCHFTGTDLSLIGESLNGNSVLQTLSVTITDTDSKAVTASQCLSLMAGVWRSALTVLDVSGLRCAMDNTSVSDSVLMVASKHSTLQSLVIGPIVDDTQSSSLSLASLSPSRSLTSLTLIGDYANDKEQEMSLPLLLLHSLQCRSLASLTLSSLTVSQRSLSVLTTSLLQSQSLSSLTLSQCEIARSLDCHSLFTVLAQSQSLKTLTFTSMPSIIANNHWQALTNVLAFTPRIQWQSLTVNKCGLAAIDDRSARALTRHQSLTTLDWTDNALIRDSLLALARSISVRQFPLHILRVAGNSVSMSDWPALIHALLNDTAACGVQTLSLPHVNIIDSPSNASLVQSLIDTLAQSSLPSIASLTLPPSLSLTSDHRAALSAALVSGSCPRLHQLTVTRKSLCVAPLTAVTADRSLNGLTAALATNRARTSQW